jgi:hypothetical protein
VIIRLDADPYVCDENRFLDYKDLLEILPSDLVATVAATPVPPVPIGLAPEDEDEDAPVSEASVEHEETSARMLVQFAHFSVKE